MDIFRTLFFFLCAVCVHALSTNYNTTEKPFSSIYEVVAAPCLEGFVKVGNECKVAYTEKKPWWRLQWKVWKVRNTIYNKIQNVLM